jgi:SAM-dependent methyltransferase
VKRLLLGVLRDTGLLKLADSMMFVKNVVQSSGRNRRFLRAHAGFAVPPASLAFDAYNHVDWKSYFEIGARHAQVFAGVIRENMPRRPLAVLEWGCGPGRLIRHMRELLGESGISLTGSDVNGRSIAWCRENLPGISFLVNDFCPPIQLPDDSFDVIYNFSVFTHLSEQAQKDWARELWRLLKPGGLFICSTHGAYYKDRIGGKADERRFDSGRVVVKTNYEEGKKWYLAIHPDAYVRGELLRDFDEVRKIALGPDALMRHDIWVARKTGAKAS